MTASTPFTKIEFHKLHASIIGAGATGSQVALMLARLGLQDIHVWDKDIVEPHNVAAQLYGNTHIGMSKVLALSNIIKDLVGIEIVAHNEFCEDGEVIPTDNIFVLTDTMKSRKKIFKSLNPFRSKYLIETRMGLDSCRVYALDLSNVEVSKRYATTLYKDEEAAVSACGGREPSVSATAQYCASLAVWQFINLVSGNEVDQEVLCFLNPITTRAINWTLATSTTKKVS